MKKTFMTTALIATLFLGTIGANAACPCQDKDGMMPPPPPGHHHMHRPLTPEQKAEMEARKAEIDKRLNITEAQKAQLKSIHEKSKAQIAPKFKQLTEIEYELDVIHKKKYAQDVYNVKALDNVKLSGKSEEQLINEAKKLRSEIREIKKAHFQESQSVFTEEQKKELEKIRQEHKKEMQKKQKEFKNSKEAKKFDK